MESKKWYKWTDYKTEWKSALCSSMDRPRDYQTKSSKSDKDNYHDIIYMWNLKNSTNELISKTEIDSQM